MERFRINSTLFILLSFFSLMCTQAQWTDNGNNTTTMDNVGIGTSSPSQQLQINALNTSIQLELNRDGNNPGKVDFGVDGDGMHYWVGGFDGSGKEEFFVGMNGRVGIGTNNPSQKFQINALDTSIQLELNRDGNNPGKVDFGVDGSGLHYWIGGYDGFGKEEFFVGMNGNVGIGTTLPNSKLTVKGKIHAEEVKVDLSVPGPDYVFKKGYDLKSLEEVQNYIREHGHLPNIPSANEMEENGIQLGEMNMKLLEKIEELTLYTLQQQKQLNDYEDQLNTLSKKLEILENKTNNPKP